MTTPPTPAGEDGFGYSVAIGEYVASARGTQLPADLVDWMKLLVLDSIGCALLAHRLPWVERLLDTLVAVEAPGEASVWGHRARLSAANAAMVNGTAVHGFELDDVGARGHWGSVTVPAALALAETGSPLSGAEFLQAVVTGIEVGSRVAECVGNVPHITCGFHGPGVYGALAAAATSAFTLGLDSERSVHTIAHAAQFTGGLMASHHGGMGKRLLQGKGAHSGVLAAQLAAHGFTNVTNVFECGYGSFPSAFSGGRDTFDLARLTDGLGTTWRSRRVNFKMWACRVPIHPALESVRALRAQRTLDAGDIERVDVGLVEGAFKAVGSPYRPSTITAAQLNLQYCLAQLILTGDVSVPQFTEEAIRDPRVLDMVSRIHVHEETSNPDGAAFLPETTLDFTLTGGEHVRQAGAQRSPGNNPIERHDVVEKFRRTTAGVLDTAGQERLIALCDGLDALADARELLEPVHAAAH